MKNIIVVGAGKGIGLQTTILLQNQYQVIALTRNSTPELEKTGVRIIEIDVVKNNLDALGNMPEEIHGVVYCPGSIRLKPFGRLTKEDFLDDFEQNVLGGVAVIQKFLPNLKKSGGASIILFSTVASKLGMPFHASIATVKSAIEGLAKSLAAELAISKIRVNVIAPSLTDTPLAAGLLNTEEKKESAGKRHPLQRVGKATEMAKLTEFLLSEDSAWITGQIIGVDGGLGSLKL